VNIHVIPLIKCESFEIGGKESDKDSFYIGVKREKEGQSVILV
jgi:hypothetical protein